MRSDVRKELAAARERAAERAKTLVDLANSADRARAEFNTRGLRGYYVAPGPVHGELWVWRDCGDQPVPVISRHGLRNDPDLWDAIAGLMGGRA